ncbi:unnamed protein product [Parnassius apollo]|uniref:(apollo) hypothetical protein n=1 Tax=Parnassius apollo TaxID=110799 RepID=A0A8S3XFR8_PARAO|nr:unnamed protein product [Parnassius apollo]
MTVIQQNLETLLALSKKLASKMQNCKPRNKVEEDYVVTVMKGIGNIKHLENNIVDKLVHCAADDSVKARVRVAALEAFHADPCSAKIKNTDLELMKKRNLDSEIRIKAYLAVIAFPCGKSTNEIKKLLDSGPVQQVRRVLNGHAELNLSVTEKRGEPASIITYKGKLINTNYDKDTLDYEGQIELILRNCKQLLNSFTFKNVPLGDDKFQFDVKIDVNGNLIPKPATLTASSTYSDNDLFDDKYRLKAYYGDNLGIMFVGDWIFKIEDGVKKGVS